MIGTGKRGWVMADKRIVNHYQFDNKDVYEQAVMEEKVIVAMRKKFNLMDGKIAAKVYEKAVDEKVFSTVVGYAFLNELRNTAVIRGKISPDRLPLLPVQGGDRAVVVQEPRKSFTRTSDGNRFKTLYEGQCVLNKRLKVVVFALIVIVAAVVVMDIKSEYSVFTYFTDYKAKMEEELIDKYEQWENELKEREAALEQK